MRTVSFAISGSRGSRGVPESSGTPLAFSRLLLREAQMAPTSKTENLPAGLAAETADFYREAMATLEAAGVPFLVGGAYAYARYTGIVRHTKDFDVFLRPRDFDRALEALARQGWQTERTSPHW